MGVDKFIRGGIIISMSLLDSALIFAQASTGVQNSNNSENVMKVGKFAEFSLSVKEGFQFLVDLDPTSSVLKTPDGQMIFVFNLP